jgi:hypothetical protein
LYRYCRNNPTKWRDPSGLLSPFVIGCGAIVAGGAIGAVTLYNGQPSVKAHAEDLHKENDKVAHAWGMAAAMRTGGGAGAVIGVGLGVGVAIMVAATAPVAVFVVVGVLVGSAGYLAGREAAKNHLWSDPAVSNDEAPDVAAYKIGVDCARSMKWSMDACAREQTKGLPNDRGPVPR